MTDNKQTRVVIVGGGLGAAGAALTLTATEELRRRFKVSLYTHGWRLGGKAASGRDATAGQRIQEHGLHIILGFYATVFQFVDTAYAEWDKPDDYAFQNWRDAFAPMWQVTMTQQIDTLIGKPGWHVWNFTLPRLPGEPGDPEPAEPIAFVVHVLKGMRDWLWRRPGAPAVLIGGDIGTLIDRAIAAAEHLANDGGRVAYDLLLLVLRALHKAFQLLIEPVLILSAEGWKIACLTDFGLTLIIGYLADVFPEGRAGYERINEQDFKDWLRHHGLNEQFVWSAPIRLIYDLGFCFKDGDSHGPETALIAAGAALEIYLQLGLGYKEAPLWRMKAGMGDTIFTPVYELLRQRGVDIKFFHRLQDIGLDGNGRFVDGLRFTRQVDLVNGSYEPLIKLPYGDQGKQLWCWPAAPDWSQIVGGEATAKKASNLESAWCAFHTGEVALQRGVDFDAVVLAMPPAALKNPARALSAADPRFARMIDTANSVPTQSVQLWFRPDLAALGWTAGPTALAGYAEPLDSWADMSQVLAAEVWPVDPPGSIQYLCGAVPPPPNPPPYGDCGYVDSLASGVEITAKDWLNRHAGLLWPATVKNGQFAWDQVRSAYYRFNLDPSELYVQNFPGTIKHRLAPGDSGFQNLFLAGDWTKTWFSGGSADIAMLSGKQAGEAIVERF